MQNSKSARAAKPAASILMSILLLGTLSLVPATKANAQVDCMGRCEQQYALCVASGGRQFKSSCQDAYESCIDACLGDSYAGLLG